ncbi:cuticle protein CP14.6-like [Uranotaenia lowii]|uniref:cuticle protein CP14.6-like n=1 Tax=Uranotaenia lowii TaxID=190385 RepID=UPI002479BBCA|nr:cuticle protein CP14.6-like [Uranotaenia lowii]
MYKKLFIASVLLTTIVSAVPVPPGGSDAEATIVAMDTVINDDGSYAYNYETSNGIKASQRSENGINANGEYSFVAPDGAEYKLTYVADEAGFRPQGAHLPVEPEAPEHVIKMLEDLRASNNPDFDLAVLDATIARLKATRG